MSQNSLALEIARVIASATGRERSNPMIRTFSEAALLWCFCTGGSGVASLGLFEYMGVVQGTGGRMIISESTLLPLGLFLGGMVTTSVVVWKIATHAKSTEGTLKHLSDRVAELEKRKTR